jgi:hypothetical protein
MSASAVSSICMAVMAGRQPVGERAAGGGHVRKQLRCLLQGDGRQHRPRRSARAQGDLWILAAALTGLDEARAHARATPGPDGRFAGATAADAQPAQLGRAAAAMASAAAMKAMGSHGVSLDGGGDSRRKRSCQPWRVEVRRDTALRDDDSDHTLWTGHSASLAGPPER